MSFFGIDNRSNRGVKQDFQLRDNIKTKKLTTNTLIVKGSGDIVIEATAGSVKTSTITASQSGALFRTEQGTNMHTVNLPAPQTGLTFKFLLTATTASTVAITTSVGIFLGTIANTGSIAQALGTTTTFTATSSIGDSIDIIGLDEQIYMIRTYSSIVGGITVA